MFKRKPTILPIIPSKLLDVAIGDYKACVKNPKYEINMDTWHDVSRHKNLCNVCFAGAVMAGTSNKNFIKFWSYAPERSPEMDTKNYYAYQALDEIRQYNYVRFLEYFVHHCLRNKDQQITTITEYITNNKETLAEKLKEARSDGLISDLVSDIEVFIKVFKDHGL